MIARKLLVAVVVALVAATTYAQQPVSLLAADAVATTTAAEREVSLTALAASRPQHKAGYTRQDTYYTKPAGSMYQTTTGQYMSIDINTWLTIPAWHTATFEVVSPSPAACQWIFYTENYNPNSRTDYSSLADDDNNLPLSLSPGYTYFGGPFVENGEVTYAMGHNSSASWPPAVVAYDDFTWLAFVDNKEKSFINTSISTKYMIGTGDYEGYMYGVDAAGDTIRTYGTYACSGATQTFPAPASPLYVRNIYLEGISFTSDTSYQPIQNNALLTLEIFSTATGELLHTLTATTGDFTYLNTSDYAGVKYIEGKLKFSKRDDNGEEIPFVVEGATTVQVSGLDNTTDIKFGLLSHTLEEFDDEPEFVNGLIPTFIDRTNTITPVPTYTYSGCGLTVMFDAIMDRAVLVDTLTWTNTSSGEKMVVGGYNTLRISAEGDTFSNDVDNLSSATFDEHGLFVNTCRPWYNSDGTSDYSLEFVDAMPSWIKAVVVDASNYDVNKQDYHSLITFEVEPNYDADERVAYAYVHCPCYTDGTLATIIQEGGAEIPEGLAAVPTSPVADTSATYNLAGQRVAATTKGIVIKNGQKTLVP